MTDHRVNDSDRPPKVVLGRVHRLIREPINTISHGFHNLDISTHGYLPFFLWLFLFFGGIWFPATGFLKAIFEGQKLPVTIWTPEGSGSLSAISILLCIPMCLMFWSWTNLALLCVMASTMGEVNRTRLLRKQQRQLNLETSDPEYRVACTRAFVVYLIAIVNGLTFNGSLIPALEAGQDNYTRIAVLSCIASFLASYRPDFFETLLQKFTVTSGTTAAPAPAPVSAPASAAEASSRVEPSKTQPATVPTSDTPDDEAARIISRQFESPTTI